MRRPGFFLALGLLAAPLCGAAPRWQAPAAPGEAGIGMTLRCAGLRCPVNPPEVGPDCWWFSYGPRTAGAPPGSEGRLACERAGPHYFAAMNGLKLEIAAGPAPAQLIEPRPLPVAAEPAPEPPRPAGRSRLPLLLAVAAGALALPAAAALALRRGRIMLLAWRYQRSRDAALLHALARLVRRRSGVALRFHQRNLDLARFGGLPLHDATGRFLRRGG